MIGNIYSITVNVSVFFAPTLLRRCFGRINYPFLWLEKHPFAAILGQKQPQKQPFFGCYSAVIAPGRGRVGLIVNSLAGSGSGANPVLKKLARICAAVGGDTDLRPKKSKHPPTPPCDRPPQTTNPPGTTPGGSALVGRWRGYARAKSLLTCVAAYLPPRAVAKPSAFRRSAISRNDRPLSLNTLA